MSRQRGSFNIHALVLGVLVLVLTTGVIRWSMLGGGIGSKKTRLAFWNGFTGPDGVVMLKIIEDFNRQNPDVEVAMQRIPWATYYNKLTVAGSDGRGPEIFVVHTDALPRIRRAGFVADISDLYTGKDAIDIKDFDQVVVDQVQFDGHLEGVPLDIHPQGAFLNKQMLKDAGYVDSNGNARAPRDRVEMMDFIEKATREAGGDLKDKQWAFAFTYWGANFRSLVPQFGGRYLDEEGNADLDSKPNLKALEFLAGIAKNKQAPPADNGLGWFGFRTKRVAMVWDGVFMLGDLTRLNDFEYLGAPIPQIGDKPGTLANSHVLCVNKTVSEIEREASGRFLKYLSDHSLEWASAGQVPARKSVRENPEFAKMPVQFAFSKQIPTMMYPPRTPVIFEFMLELDRAVERVVRGQIGPKEALAEANKNAQTVIDRDRREYPTTQNQSEVKP